MRLYSTNDKSNVVELKQAVLNAFPKDKGLYMPINIPALPSSFFENIGQYSLGEIGYQVAYNMIGDYIPESELYQLIQRAMNFPAPLVKLTKNISTLELWHGPTMAFKDFGARFMAELMSYFLKDEDQETTILVATSGDTGGAVAAGFYDVPGINVIILYPSGKVSKLQEKQLTTWGKNIRAIEIDGVFDDCQSMVKQAFLDTDLQQKYKFSSANSINFARLLPQSFYYFEGYKQVEDKTKPVVFSIPSGNFGNLTAGLLAMKMGLPIHKFIAATNDNKTVPVYLSKGEYLPRPSIPTYSNAMDVGNPSNFPRMKALFGDDGSTWNIMKDKVVGYHYDNSETLAAIKTISKEHNYTADPHGSIGYLACKHYLQDYPGHQTIFLETAHHGKFNNIMEKVLDLETLPQRLESFMTQEKVSTLCSNNYLDFKNLLA